MGPSRRVFYKIPLAPSITPTRPANEIPLGLTLGTCNSRLPCRMLVIMDLILGYDHISPAVYTERSVQVGRQLQYRSAVGAFGIDEVGYLYPSSSTLEPVPLHILHVTLFSPSQ